jgi:nitrile hydratase
MAHDHDHHDHHDHAEHHEGSELSEMQLRVRALESILVEKGYVDPAALDEVIESYETRIGPHIGAGIVARAWVEPDFRRALVADATKLIRTLGHIGPSDHIMALENTPQVHHIVVCTLCSCYPIPVLGLPPMWYKSQAYRSRTVADPRGVLRDFGFELPADTEIRVWDATAELRYIVVPMRPDGTEGWDPGRLASLVTRDCMIGTAVPQKPAGG